MLTNISTRPHHRPTNLVELLLECHVRIRRYVELARRVATQTGVSEEHVAEACAEIGRYFRLALPLHVADEEESILPRLIGNVDDVDRALETMTRQHAEHAADLDTFLVAVDAVLLTPRSDARKAALLSATARLEESFVDHLALEESTIFPAIGALLSDGAESEIAAEIRQRRAIAQTGSEGRVRKGT